MATVAKQSERQSVYQIITDRILDKLREGVVPWHKPWSGAQGWPKSLGSNKRYRGVNCFLLGMLDFEQPWFVTYKQAQSVGGNVRKGERGFPVVFWTKWETTDRHTGDATTIPVLRYYTVFNVDQCEGVDYEAVNVATYEHEPIVSAERIVESYTGPVIATGFTHACYRQLADRIEMPSPERFETREAYHGALFHELIHSTGHSSRLARDGVCKLNVFGSEPYAREELIAEMGAAFLCGECGIVDRVIDNSASYIDGWRARLSRDPKLIVQAAGAAQKAADLVMGRTWE